MAEAVGALHAEITASSSKFQQELDRGRQAARRWSKDTKKDLGAAKGSIDNATKSTQGLNAGITASAGLMRNFGAQALGPLGELANNFASLQTGAGALSVGLVGLTIVFLDIKEALRLASAEADRMSDALLRQSRATEDLLAIRKRMAALDADARQHRTGKSSDLLQIEDEIEYTKRILTGAQVAADRYRSGSASTPLTGSLFDLITGEGRARNVAEGAVARLTARLEELERARTRMLEEESRKRADVEKRETDTRTREVERLSAAAEAAERRRSQALSEQIGSLQRKSGDILFDALKARREAEQDLAAIGESPLAHQLRMLDRQREKELDAAYAIGASTEAVRRKFEALRRLAIAQQDYADQLQRQAETEAGFNAGWDAIAEEDRRRSAEAESLRQRRMDPWDVYGFSRYDRKQPEEAKAELTELQKLAGSVGQTFASSFGGAIADAVVEARNLGDALRDVGRLVLSTAVQLAVSGSVSSIFGGLKVPGFATGGSFTVGGSGGIDSQLVAFKATPGEQVSVTPPGRGGMNVNIHNYAGARVATRESEGPSGPQLDVLIEDVVSRSIEGGGKVSRALSRANGLRRRGRRG